MSNLIENWYLNKSILVPKDCDDTTRSRLHFFLEWLQTQNNPWHEPNLRAYSQALLAGNARINQNGNTVKQKLKPSTIRAHLSTIRSRYSQLLHDNDIINSIPRKARERLQNDLHPVHTKLPTRTIQDHLDSEQMRLTPEQVQDLISQPIHDLRGTRNRAIIALLACTGIRAIEAINLTVPDIMQFYGGEPALRVTKGKGIKQRAVPYGPFTWAVEIVNRWTHAADIHEGHVFRPVTRAVAVPNQALSTRSLRRILAAYPILTEAGRATVRPHDLRRSYARNAYDSGMQLESIRQNLGHVNLATTLRYIGPLDARKRRPLPFYQKPD